VNKSNLLGHHYKMAEWTRSYNLEERSGTQDMSQGQNGSYLLQDTC